jgi:hypothetical protein
MPLKKKVYMSCKKIEKVCHFAEKKQKGMFPIPGIEPGAMPDLCGERASCWPLHHIGLC